MKKLAITLSALAALTGSAFAADMAPAPRAYSKAPVIVPTPSWTGFYLFGGGGYGIWDADSYSVTTPPGVATSTTQRMGGDGYFGTVGAGYDWQFNTSWVGGVFADGQFGSLKGTIQDVILGVAGRETDRTNWAAGVRVGYLVAPTVLSYVNAGYTGAQFSGSTLTNTFLPGPFASTTPSFTRSGWFLGGGVENQLGILGFGPNWFMKTEYRVAEYSRATLTESVGGVPTTFGTTFNPIVQTVSTSIVYRFNWTGPVVAKY
jgi:outer membrane immunogenic protein